MAQTFFGILVTTRLFYLIVTIKIEVCVYVVDQGIKQARSTYFYLIHII